MRQRYILLLRQYILLTRIKPSAALKLKNIFGG